uniref:Putative ixodes 10 kDa peptide protein n=1 Tax=Ixodes ricinus TaxID=34613 RepID=A0A0K8RLK7_IXORI
MYRNISNMMLVLFAVVLILPAFQGEGFLSGIFVNFHCYDYLDPAATLLCKLHGSEHIGGKHPRTCQVTCSHPYQKLGFPRAVCPAGGLKCDAASKATVSKWKEELERRKNIVCSD